MFNHYARRIRRVVRRAVSATPTLNHPLTVPILASLSTALLVCLSLMVILYIDQTGKLRDARVDYTRAVRTSNFCEMKPVVYVLEAKSPDELLKKVNDIHDEFSAERKALTKAVVQEWEMGVKKP